MRGEEQRRETSEERVESTEEKKVHEAKAVESDYGIEIFLVVYIRTYARRIKF